MLLYQMLDMLDTCINPGTIVYHDLLGQALLTMPYEAPTRLFTKVLKIWAKDDDLHILLETNFNRE